MTESTITRAFYEAFQRVKFDRWDTIIAQDVLINSPAGLGIRGLQTFKDFAVQFTDLGYRIDLIDEHLALDESGTGRGFITFCLNWKHTSDFGGLAPTGREGTSVEPCLLTIVEHKITRIDVADNTLDLGIYEWQRGWPIPHNIQPEPIVTGIDRRTPAATPQRDALRSRDAASTLGHDGQALRGGTIAECPTPGARNGIGHRWLSGECGGGRPNARHPYRIRLSVRVAGVVPGYPRPVAAAG